MAKTNYLKYKILIDPDSKKVQGLKTGDVVRRQYYDAPGLVYSLMVVLETGVEMVGGADSAYFIGALVEGDAPETGQPLDFVRVTNLFDRERGGALYLTASDSDAPYMDVIDGLATEHSLLSAEDILRSEGAFRFPLDRTVSHPEKLLISYKIRASKPLENVPLTLGYEDKTDGSDSILISTEWEYKLTVITIDYPAQYTRELCIAPTLDKGGWCEIKDLNVVRLSDISNFSKAAKVRIGRITGVVDPVFGTLDGYGAYFRNLYATRNVNIAGTLTAGDENGFASTFYVGKIHKNVIPNSLCPIFTGAQPIATTEKSPAGMGGVWGIGQSVTIEVQSADWRKSHTGQTYCFSIWVRSQEAAAFTLKQDGYHFGDIQIDGDGAWKRFHATFTVRDTAAGAMVIGIDTTTAVLISSPQMESGETPSLYQPTDGTLSMVEDYGAWFSKGGIGGTIQNPLLKLNEDGSISSRDGSFVINPDGTGHFASGRFSWNKDTITLQDFTVRWENLSEDTRENLKGEAGKDGVDANLLDWVQEWNSGKTVIDGSSVITPKIFAGVKNANNTITGVALGRFSLLSRNDAGQFQSESIDGIYGFRDGYKTFAIDTTGNVTVGRGDQSIKYNALTGKIEFGAAVSMLWAGATYIDANGIFTGTLSATTIQAITINASQITAGKINAALIDTASLKTELITAANIEALTLNVVRGTIGGWSIDADSIYRGTKNNAVNSFTSANGYITVGSNGIRGYKWRLESTGAGAVAGGNISWDVAGNVTFGQSVTVQWTAPLETLQQQIDNTVTPRLTQISATGIYTGTLTAAQVNAVGISASSITTGMLDAGRIAAGSITVDKLDVTTLKANLITAANINGLSLSFVQGVIGGWTIDSTGIYADIEKYFDKSVVQLRKSSSGSGAWNTGEYKPLGLSFIWNRSIYNSGHIVLGQVAASAASEKTGFYGIQMIGTGGTEYFCLSANVSLGSKVEVYNRIAGWAFDSQKIWKNNVSLGSDGSIVNGTCWHLNNDGSGRLANGNIRWDAAGNVTFSESVILGWGIDARMDGIVGALGGPSYQKLTYISGTGIYTGTLTAAQVNAIDIDASSITTGTLSAARIAASSITVDKLDVAGVKANLITADNVNGLTLTFDKGTIGGWVIGQDNISSGTVGMATYTAIQIRTTSTGSGTWYSGFYKPAGITITWINNYYAGHIVMGQVAASANTVKNGYFGIQMMDYLGYEYFCLSADTGSAARITYNRIAGWGFDYQQIWKNNVYLSSDGSIVNGTKWKLNNDGSGQIANGNISWNSSGVVTFSASVALNWSNGNVDGIISALGGSSYPKLTQITSTGVYTGTVNANQVMVNSTLTVGGSAGSSSYNGKISVCNTSNIAVATLDTMGIIAVAGRIGGWTMTSTALYSGNIYLDSNGYIYNGTYWRLNSNGSGLLASNNISWDAAGAITLKNAIIQDVMIKGTVRTPFVRVDGSISITIGGGTPVVNRPDSEKYDNMVVIAGTDSAGWNLQSPVLPWNYEQSGRRLTLVHYRYGSEYCYGTATFTAPSGYFFYENGLTASKLNMSREVVELMGYGTSTAFYGWIVLNRRDIGTTSRYGGYTQYLAMGTVTTTTSSCSIKYKTYDGSTITASRTGTGQYTVYLPWALGADKYMVMLSGIWYDGPIYATIKSQYSSYFYVQTGDDNSANNGSFNFIVVSTADFK